MAETVKMVLLSVGIMSTIVLLRVAVIPYASSTVASVVSSVPAIAGCIRTWLSPPYIYIILNFIIILIVAQNHLPAPKTTGEGFRTAEETTDGTETAKDQHQRGEMTENVEAKERSEEEEEEDVVKESGGVAVSKGGGGGRSSHKTQEEEEEEEASLEETWVKIMEAGERRQLKKSETWDTPPRVVVEDDPVRRELNKSATFKETAKSMGQEELNRQAEAFIRKFKLQRLESHQRFLNQLVNAT